MGVSFDVVSIDCDEDFPQMPPSDVAAYLAQKKAEAFHDLKPNELLITSDTTVLHNGQVINKPADHQEAMNMLRGLCGSDHQVVTGVSLRTLEKTITFSETTTVRMDPCTDEEIRRYINEHQPFDKAGSYGIQDWMGLCKIGYIQGCFYNVMGLPCSALYQNLNQHFQIHV